MNRRKFFKNLALAAAGGVGSAALLSFGSSTSRIPITRMNHPRFLVMGIGGAGGGILSNLHLFGLSPDNLIWLNSDEHSAVRTKARDHCKREILIGKKVTGGNSTERNFYLGRQAVLENETDVKQLISGTDLLFITAGLGGGLGSGASPAVAQWGQDAGCIVAGLFSTPFSFEGKRSTDNASECLNQFSKHSDMVHVVSNDIGEKINPFPNFQLGDFFDEVDKLFFKMIQIYIT